MPGWHSSVFMLREMNDFETDVICKELEISTSYLWVLLHRARARLANGIK
ncbi:RNA polymerase sigma factor [Novipirellula galeiformis]|uniref:RNA polymerase sigma factor n=1 Tax=Novipirellula galeiformis TaxID=2528004 RepID=A0A5C6CMJ9_9BACT|nr:RNA polymerase sigma factor [Novipirellula galeiformis]